MALMKAKTSYGVAVGCSTDGGRSTVFRGVPYGSAPVGELRFRAPVPPEPWEGERVFDVWAPECIQTRLIDPEETGIGLPPSEDCLRLNIWTPAKTPEDGLPVVVWLHGGERLYEKYFVGIDGVVCRKNLVLVTPVWRSGVLGWFGLEEFEDLEEHGSTGAYGALDVLAALRWVKENIRAFGGDPDRITLGGHSSGGMLAKGIAGSEASDGLFRRLLLMSAGGTWDAVAAIPKADKCRRSRAAMEAAGLTVEDMLTGDASEISRLVGEAVKRTAVTDEDRQVSFLRPSADGWALTEDFGKALYDGKGQDREVLCGMLITEWNAQAHQIPGGIEGYEAAFSAAAALSLAQRNAELGRKPVYHYFFNHYLPGGKAVGHCSELPYVFGRLKAEHYPWRDYDYLIENAVMEYWARFVHTGDPNTPGAPEWPAYTTEEPWSLHITDTGIWAENLLLDEKTSEALDYLMQHPGAPDQPFFQ